ncbi:uncharacterized protein PAC_04530 [Phialocephala subalpina]|uniref:Uncharacterized protein n=1 Tax=Phialocephala subalpina TaxID=576137 RepID=A0A1L7WPE6_9HELO|nr:uncharacterized protein PAC_04530 [Phialocephala subalpina]
MASSSPHKDINKDDSKMEDNSKTSDASKKETAPNKANVGKTCDIAQQLAEEVLALIPASESPSISSNAPQHSPSDKSHPKYLILNRQMYKRWDEPKEPRYVHSRDTSTNKRGNKGKKLI